MTEELQIPEKVRKVYEWCSQLTAESRTELESSYIWPDEIRQLASRLILTKGALIALQGYSGTGKSSALAMIGQIINKNKIQYALFKLVNHDLARAIPVSGSTG